MRSTVVKNVDPWTYGLTPIMIGVLNCTVAKNAHMNGLSESPTHASSQYLESAPQRVILEQNCERQDAGGSPDLPRKLGARDSTPSCILVIIQLLLKNNTKYWGIFWRNVRAGVFS
jgi:hypothetical protein